MTIEELLEELDENGLVITDWDLIIETMSKLGYAPFDEISESHRVRIVKLTNTCYACPAQWEGETQGGADVYIRYRWGHLRVDLGGETFFNKMVGGGLDGTMNYEELKTHLENDFELPQTCEEE